MHRMVTTMKRIMMKIHNNMPIPHRCLLWMGTIQSMRIGCLIILLLQSSKANLNLSIIQLQQECQKLMSMKINNQKTIQQMKTMLMSQWLRGATVLQVDPMEQVSTL